MSDPSFPVSPAVLAVLRGPPAYTSATSPAGALLHGTQLVGLAIDTSSAWTLAAWSSNAIPCSAATLAELIAASDPGDGSGAFVSVIGGVAVRRVLTLSTSAGAVCADEPGGPPPP